MDHKIEKEIDFFVIGGCFSIDLDELEFEYSNQKSSKKLHTRVCFCDTPIIHNTYSSSEYIDRKSDDDILYTGADYLAALRELIIFKMKEMLNNNPSINNNHNNNKR
eukprot:Pgem_evm1s10177